MNYKDIIKKVSKELNLPENVVNKTYRSYWLFIKTAIESLPLREDITEEEFNSLRTNFNIGSLGKLSVTWDTFIGCKKRFKIIRKLKGESNAKD